MQYFNILHNKHPLFQSARVRKLHTIQKLFALVTKRIHMHMNICMYACTYCMYTFILAVYYEYANVARFLIFLN